MTRRRARTLAVLLVVGGLGALTSAPAAQAQGDLDLTVTLVDGAPTTSRTLFSSGTLAPGNGLRETLVVTTSGDVRGPLELRLVPRSAPNDLEDDLVLTTTVGARTVRAPLPDLLRGGDPLPVVELSGPGRLELDLAVLLDPASPNPSRLQVTVFDLVLSVQGIEVRVLGNEMDRPGPGAAPATEVLAAATSPGRLAVTGSSTAAVLTVGAVAVGAGAALVAGTRRRRASRWGGRRAHPR